LLDSLGLSDKADANMRQLSGGMKRRMLVAQALVHKPPVIVLDEPTAGVDVQLRQTLWQFIARLNRAGNTVLLTTHYLEEAEALCGRLAMLKAGRVVALERTSELLKAASSNVLRFKVDSALPPELAGKARVTGRIVQLPAHDALEIEHHLAVIRQAGLRVEDVEVRKADLEDVFLDVMARHGEVPGVAPSVEPVPPPARPTAIDEAAGVEIGS
jgi:ABC-2 type transport system ATP-binding protein